MSTLAVVPVLIGPLQILITILPGLIVAAVSALISLLHPRAVLNGLKILWRQKLQVAVVVVVLAGVVYGAGWLWDTFGPNPADAAGAAVAGTDWPTARGDLRRTGVVPGHAAPVRGGVNWVFKQDYREFFAASPAVVGNRVYTSSAFLHSILPYGMLYCFDADTGAKVWELKPSGYRPTFSSPVVAGGYLVVGEGFHDTKDGRIVCVDIRDEKNPRVVWTQTANDHVESTPVIYKDRVIANAGDDGVYCLALEPNADGSAKLLWHVHGERYYDCETALAVYDDKVYVGMGFEGFALAVLDVNTGKELHRLETGAPVFSPPSIADGKVYFATGFADYVADWEDARTKMAKEWHDKGMPEARVKELTDKFVKHGEVWCMDLKTGQVDWRFRTTASVLGAVVVAGEQLYCTSRDGRVYCLSRTGKLLAEWDSHTPVLTSPAVTERYVYVVDSQGGLHVLDRQLQDLVWERRLGRPRESIEFVGSPTVARGHVYVGTVQDGLLCLGEPGEQAPPLWPAALGGPGKAGNLDESSLPAAGELLWPEPPSFFATHRPDTMQAPVAALGDLVFAPLASGRGAGLVCYRVAGKEPEVVWRYSLPNGVHTSPVVFKHTAWCVDGKLGDAGRQLHALDAATGKVLWKAPVHPAATGVLLATADRLYMQDRPGELACFTHTGEREWSQKIGGKLMHAPTVTPSMIVVLSSQPGVLLALDRPTGRVLWPLPDERSLVSLPALVSQPTTSPVVRKDRIYFGSHRGLEARSLLDGSEVPGWKYDGGGASADFALLRDTAVYVNTQGELVVVRLTDGTGKARVTGATPRMPPLVSKDAALFVAPGKLMQVKLGDEKIEAAEWASLDQLGEVTAPLVLLDGRVYTATSACGLVVFGKE